MEIRIVDDDGRSSAPREVGELLMRMQGKQREYYKDDDATASTWTDDGWLRTGDLAYLDEDGFLYICGRKKDMIIRGGNNIYATDVEAVLLEHPDVQEAAVAGVPHDGARRGRRRVGRAAARRVARRRRAARRSVPSASPTTSARGTSTSSTSCPRNATGKVMKHKLEHPPRPASDHEDRANG